LEAVIRVIPGSLLSYLMAAKPVLSVLLCVFMALMVSVNSFSQKIYKTPSGTKYHLGSCRMVNNVAEEVSLQRALDLGLGPCRICKPNAINTNQLHSSNTPQGAKSTMQCKGITKAGTRCRHRTSLANGFCYQHNPEK